MTRTRSLVRIQYCPPLFLEETPYIAMNIFQKIFDFFIPPDCISCGEERSILCENCVKKLKRSPLHTFSSPLLQNIFVLGEYEDKILEKSLHELKYHFAVDIIKSLSPFIKDQLQNLPLSPESVFVPIPLHFFRMNERGFNQSELLASAFQKAFLEVIGEKYEIVPLLKRTRNTPHQVHLSPEERKENMKSAFKALPSNISKDTPLLLIDDVASTLSTLHEGAEALKKEGFKNISAIVLARSQQTRDTIPKKSLAEKI